MNKFLFLLEQVLLEGFDDRKITLGDYTTHDGKEFIKGGGVPDLGAGTRNSEFFLSVKKPDGSKKPAKVRNYAFTASKQKEKNKFDYIYKAAISKYSDIKNKVLAEDDDDRFVFFYKIPSTFKSENEERKLAQFIQSEFFGGFEEDKRYNTTDTVRLEADIDKKRRMIDSYKEKIQQIETDNELSAKDKSKQIKSKEAVITALKDEIEGIQAKIENLDHRITNAADINIHGVIDDIEEVSFRVIDNIGSNSCTYGEYMDAVTSFSTERHNKRKLSAKQSFDTYITLRNHKLDNGEEIYSADEGERMEQIYAHAQKVAEEAERHMLEVGFSEEEAAQTAEERYNKTVENEIKDYGKRKAEREANAEAARLERNRKAKEWRDNRKSQGIETGDKRPRNRNQRSTQRQWWR